MAKYICSVCGYIYDEAKGIPDVGIAAGTTWEQLAEDWICPLCGAAKSEFVKQDETAHSSTDKLISATKTPADMKEMSSLEVSALCTNLSRGCEKQYKAEQAALFRQLSDYFKRTTAPAKDANFDQLLNLVEKDLDVGFPDAYTAATENKDRGALRALVWGEKVTRIQKSLLTRYQKKGHAILDNTDVYLCTICGFIYIGDTPPEICPVCKVPNWKFIKIEGGKDNG